MHALQMSMKRVLKTEQKEHMKSNSDTIYCPFELMSKQLAHNWLVCVSSGFGSYISQVNTALFH